MLYKNKEKGFTLLEVVVGLGILSFIIFGLFLVSQISLRIVNASTRNTQAIFLMEEGVEAVKVLRGLSWESNIKLLNNETSYYLNFSNNTWQSTTTPVFTDGFERKFVSENVYRDANDDIAAGGNPDPDTKKITIFVSWPETNGTTTKSVSTYIANIFKN
ncbi:MAG: type II secretion system protein [Candidatus Parcubacteria bacterium]|nr:type II secretion system protein [Candidatus Parcubacteria bacterium]